MTGVASGVRGGWAAAAGAPRRAFTMVEMVVVVTVVVIVAALMLPKLGDEVRVRLVAASAVLVSDIEAAQSMTIASPDQAVVVRFDAAGGRYWLARADTPETPLTRPDTGEPYLVVLGEGRASGAAGVTMTLADLGGDVLEFDAQGAVKDFSRSPSITLGLDGRWVRLDVATTTGTITEVEGEG